MSKKNSIILERRFVPEGKIIIKEGEVGYSAFLIQSGSVCVYSEAGGKMTVLAELGVGEICGEMALIDEDCRSASVKAIENSTLIMLTRTAFEEKLRKSDPTIKAVVKMLIKRVKTANDGIIKFNSEEE